ncbi:hypothetical protein WCLP8_2770005 [uncultured Gammaproteobacteria bacterium]
MAEKSGLPPVMAEKSGLSPVMAEKSGLPPLIATESLRWPTIADRHSPRPVLVYARFEPYPAPEMRTAPLTTIFRVAVILAVCSAFAAQVWAAEQPKAQSLGSFKDWSAYTFVENGNKVCYMSSEPKKKEPGTAKRGKIFFLITHRPAEKSLDVVSVVAGYAYKKGSAATVTIDKKAFSLFVDRETAWAKDDKTDTLIVTAMRSGTQLVVKGTSLRGTNTTDTYSLSGTDAAYKAINDACGVKR